MVFSVAAALWNASDLCRCQILSLGSMSHAPKMHLAGFRYFVHLIWVSQETQTCGFRTVRYRLGQGDRVIFALDFVLWRGSIATPHQYLKKSLCSPWFPGLRTPSTVNVLGKIPQRAQRKKLDQALGYCGEKKLLCSSTGQIVHWALEKALNSFLFLSILKPHILAVSGPSYVTTFNFLYFFISTSVNS